MNSEYSKFKSYAEQLKFWRKIINDNIKVLLIGSEQFKKDILGNKKENKLSKGKYNVCICEEDSIKELNKYVKKIKDNIFVVSNDEKSELILECRKPSMNENENNEEIKYENYYDNELSNEINDVISEYSDVILANPEEIHDILCEFYVEIFNGSRFLTKLEQLNLLHEEIQEDAEELNINLEDN